MATLTEVCVWLPGLRFSVLFRSCKANARVKPAKTGHGPHYSKMFVLFCVLFVCMCTVLLPPGGYPIAVNKYIIYYIISYHIIYRIIYNIISRRIISSYHIIYRIVPYIISHHIISYRIKSYHISRHLIIYNIVSNHIIYHVISYHIISYHNMYHISYHIYHIVSYIITYRIISYINAVPVPADNVTPIVILNWQFIQLVLTVTVVPHCTVSTV
jgi:hypothetical protein